MARSPAKPSLSAFQALRSKLNGLSYVQPFSEESLALVERLLEDLLKSAESYRVLQREEQSSRRKVWSQKRDSAAKELKRLPRAQWGRALMDRMESDAPMAAALWLCAFLNGCGLSTQALD
eukprot:s170_g26.t1